MVVLRTLRKYMVSIIVIAILGTSFYAWSESRQIDANPLAGVERPAPSVMKSVLESEQLKREPSYLAYYADLQKNGAKDTQGVNIAISGMDFSAKSDTGTELQSSLGGRTGNVIALKEEDSWVEYKIDVPQDGFYQAAVTYYAMDGKRASVVRDIQIDGKYPFYQAKKIEFSRMWKEEGPTVFDNQGNEMNPRQVEVIGWQDRIIRDAEGKVKEPLRFYFTKGTHAIRINAIREPAAIAELRFFSPQVVPAYADVLKAYEAKGYKEVKDQLFKPQAENVVLKSDPTLRRTENHDPIAEPLRSTITLNTMGGWAWRKGGQWMEWEIEAPESGLYNIGGRFASWFLNGIPTERIITIDGNLPFKEMEEVKFPYAQNWQLTGFNESMADKPYLYYLEKGKHRLRLEVQVEALGQIFETIQNVTQQMSLLSRELIQVTGPDPDTNRDYELEKSIANLPERLTYMAFELQDGMQSLYSTGVPKGSSQLSAIGMARDLLLDMAKNTSTIPSRMKSITDTQSSLGSWINDMTNQALEFDYLVVKSPNMDWPPATAPFHKRIWQTTKDFFGSFTKDYSGIGNIYKDQQVLNVWVARGRDWAQLIKQMADETFSPDTGIKVNVNVIPAGSMDTLLLATTSGLQPDVALGVGGEIPIDFAIRDGVQNLNVFPDYKDVAARFRPGALVPFKYNGGDFALPENQNFNMLFYRKDILQQLGIPEDKIPQTWQEVMDIIPLLQQNGYDFFYPHSATTGIGEFAPFLFQNGGDFYKEAGKFSALDTPEALKAVKMWTELYTNYKISKEANFYNRFRTGEMPIGVADYGTYVLLSTAAPELTGWWGMKPMPGVKEPDGTINRFTGGLSETAMLFKASKMKEQGWKFMKWWTSTETQVRFGGELEAIMGVEARWNTANVEALKQLPWQKEDITNVLEQWNWFKEREVVLGGYYTTRHVANIWNEIVLNGKIPREAIEAGVKEINKELRKKREEFGLDTAHQQTAGKEGGANG